MENNALGPHKGPHKEQVYPNGLNLATLACVVVEKSIDSGIRWTCEDLDAGGSGHLNTS